MSDELLAVADAENRYPSAQNRGVDGRAGGVVNAAGAAGDDDASGVAQIFKRRFARKNRR
jgi:hypothetical protein